MLKLVPQQSDVTELVDGEITDHQLLRHNLQDMAEANRWLGARRSLIGRVGRWLHSLPPGHQVTVLDVATGGGDFPLTLHQWSVRQGRAVTLLASDVSRDVLRVAYDELKGYPVQLIQHDALHMPFRDRSIDIITCSQALHHFDRSAVVRLLQELARVARLGVLVSDLRRSYISYWGARLMAHGPVSTLSRHDGPLSVLRAYTPAEVDVLARRANVAVQVRRAPGFRIEIELKKG
jgi:SAM-dependent methyltransferase